MQRTIPPEIVLHIISLLDKQTLLALLGSNKLISGEAERHLYRNIDISSPTSPIIDAFHRSPERKSFVHSLSIASNTHPNLLPRINFSQFINLRSLTIIPNTGSTLYSALDTLSKCYFPHLIHFRSVWSLNDATFKHFLSSHPTIQSLGLTKQWSTFSVPAASSFPSTLLPSLYSIDGHWSNVARLIGGRPVTSITLNSARIDGCISKSRFLQIVPLLANSRRPIDKLSVSLDAVTPDTISSIAQYLPDLRALAIHNGSPVVNAEDGTLEGAAHELGIALATFASFASLEEVALTRIGEDDEPDFKAVVVSILGDMVPSLRRATLGEMDMRSSWTRGSPSGEWIIDPRL